MASPAICGCQKENPRQYTPRCLRSTGRTGGGCWRVGGAKMRGAQRGALRWSLQAKRLGLKYPLLSFALDDFLRIPGSPFLFGIW